MKRARKNTKNIEDQILDIDIEIERLKEGIANLKANRKKLLQQKEQEDMRELMLLVKESGKTPAEFLVAISQAKQQGQ